jgi:hypothetical protein
MSERTPHVYHDTSVHFSEDGTLGVHHATRDNGESCYWLSIQVPTGPTTWDRITVYLTRDQVRDLRYQAGDALDKGKATMPPEVADDIRDYVRRAAEEVG